MAALLLAVAVFASSLLLAAGGGNADDTATLLAFKDAVSAAPSSPLSAWDPARASHCLWFGVSCDAASGRVVAINLTTAAAPGSTAAISGPLPDLVANLTQLRVLSLRFNAFSGRIPAAIGRLRRLEVLDLRGNNFSGGIPVEVNLLTSLVIIDLAYNSFSGQIPSGLLGLAGVRTVDLSHNLLSGEITVNGRSRCPSLEHLALSRNLIVGRIPPEIGNCSRLRRLLLDENVLEGGIPAEMGRLSELRVLDVSLNSLTDRIPAEIGACREVQALVLTNLESVKFTSFGSSSFPRVEFNSFVGGMPWEVFAIPSLELLWAPRANHDGRLPDRWGASCRLRVLNLGQNYRISGGIPQGLGV